jgi:hypothetical protein
MPVKPMMQWSLFYFEITAAHGFTGWALGMNTLRLTDNHKNFGRVGTIQLLPLECGSFFLFV